MMNPFVSDEKKEEVLDRETEPVIAVPVPFEQLKDHDRFVIVNQERMRTITSVRERNTLVAAMVRGRAEGLTYLPEHALILTLEKTGGTHFRMRAEEGCLTFRETGSSLSLEKEISSCGEWAAESGGKIRCAGAREEEGEQKDRYLYIYGYETEFTVRELQEETLKLFEMTFYRLEEDWKPVEDEGSGYRLPVFETSDIHGNIANWGNGERIYTLGGLAALVTEARCRTGKERFDTAVLLDGGDIFQGITLSNMSEGKPLLEAFHAMQYDAVTVGNHDFDWEIEAVIGPDAALASPTEKTGVSIPVVMANLYQNGEKTPWTRDFVILEKTARNGEGKELPVRIGVIGFSENYGPSIRDSLFRGRGFEIREDYEQIRELGKRLKGQEHCDAVLLLAHSDAGRIASRLDPEMGIDLVLGGHRHFSDFGTAENGIPYGMPAGNGIVIAHSELVFEQDGSGKTVLRRIPEPSVWEGKVRRKERETAAAADEKVIRISDAAIDQLKAYLDEDIGRISVDVLIDEYIPGSGKRSSTGGNWYSSIYARAAHADISFFNQFGMRKAFRIPEGETELSISTGDVLEMFPFNNRIQCFELTCEELLTAFRYALTEDGGRLLGMVTGIDCYFRGKTVLALVRNGEICYAHGKWFNGHETHRVRVAISDFVASTNRNGDGMDNPFVAWAKTARLKNADISEAEEVLRVLRQEASEHSGVLFIDEKPHFIEGDIEVPQTGA